VQAYRRLLVILSVLLLHLLVLLGLSFGSLLLLSALGLLLLDGLLVIVALVGSGPVLTTLLGLAALGIGGLALLQNVSVRFEWTIGEVKSETSSPAASRAFLIFCFSLSTMTWHAFMVRPSGRLSSGHGIGPALVMIWRKRPTCTA
jgi:hypothetical protein